jgi:hypothetical protein
MRLEQRCHHRLELARRAGQQQDHARSVRYPQSGRAAERVRQHLGAVWHLGLPAIRLRHRIRQVSRREPFEEMRGDGRILAQRAIEHGGHDLTRHIVVGRTETPAADDEVGTRPRQADRLRELVAIVANDGLVDHLDADTIELIGDEQRVGIDARGRQQLAADGENRGARQWSRRRGRRSFRHTPANRAD